MARCPFATWRPLPENSTEPAIRPTQVIVHTMVGSLDGTDGWFRRSDVSTESHFGTGQDGRVFQWVDTGRQADANYKANVRAISIETEDRGNPNAPWSAAQLDVIVRLVDWSCRTHDIPRRLAPAWDAPGLGWHVMYPQWSNVRGKTCPGSVRIDQFRKVVLPRVQRLGEEPDVEEVLKVLRQIRDAQERCDKVAKALKPDVWEAVWREQQAR